MSALAAPRRGGGGGAPAGGPRHRRAILAGLAGLAFALAVDVLAFGPGRLAGNGGAAGAGGSDAVAASPGTPAASEGLPGGEDASPGAGPGTAQGGTGVIALPQASEAATAALGNLLTLLAATEPTDGNSQASATLAGEVPDAAVALLDAYHAGPTCMLAHEGYLDLSGNSWGCVVQGEGWVDVAVVQTYVDGGSRVSITRMHVGAWAEGSGAEAWDE